MAKKAIADAKASGYRRSIDLAIASSKLQGCDVARALYGSLTAFVVGIFVSAF